MFSSPARSDPRQPFTSFSFPFSPLSACLTAGLSCLSGGSSCEMQGLSVWQSGNHLVLLIVNESFTSKISSEGCYSSVWLAGSSWLCGPLFPDTDIWGLVFLFLMF